MTVDSLEEYNLIPQHKNTIYKKGIETIESRLKKGHEIQKNCN